MDDLATSRLARLQRVLRAVREHDPDLTVQQLLAFVEVAVFEGVSISELGRELEIAQSTATRTADILGRHGRGGRRALEWIQRQDDPEDRRTKRLYLTLRGRAMAERLARALRSPEERSAAAPRPAAQPAARRQIG